MCLGYKKIVLPHVFFYAGVYDFDQKEYTLFGREVIGKIGDYAQKKKKKIQGYKNEHSDIS